MSSGPRIAVGSVFVECNHLGGNPTDLACFERYELIRDGDIFGMTEGVIGGTLAALWKRSADVVPLMVATACAGGPVTADCYRQLKSELLGRLADALPVAGVALPLHGAGTVEDVPDLEGDLLRSTRELVGPHVPIVTTLDLHAHITSEMVRNAAALLAWETYPHRDAFETGQRGVSILLGILDGLIKPTMALGKVPVITSALHGSTEGDDPFAEVMRFAKSLEKEEGVVSTSVLLVQPYLDLPDMGSGGLVVTNDDPERAARLAREIAWQYWERRFDLDPDVLSPAEAIARGLRVEGGPVLLVEAADCCGGGAAGDSVATLKALLAANVTSPSLVPVTDPDAAAQCHRAGIGAEISVSLGHKLDPKWGTPVAVTGRVSRLSQGDFQYTGGVWSGQWAHMGPSAILEIGAIQVLVTANATYDWADEQFQSMGIDARRAKFIVVKNPMNYRLGYGDVARRTFILDTPGPTPATLDHVEFRNVRRPYYPRDRDIPDLQPTILCSSP